MDYKCKNCLSKSITLEEYWGAFDGRMTYTCQDCKKGFHRCGMEVIEKHQIQPYGDIYFTLMGENGKLLYYRNLYEI